MLIGIEIEVARDELAAVFDHRTQPEMCVDNVVAESFFQLSKRERIRPRRYSTRENACREIFEYAELFYKQTHNGMLPPVDFEFRQQKLNEAAV